MRRIDRTTFASIAAVMLSLLVAAQAAAASWYPPFRVGAGVADGLVILGSVDAAVLYTVLADPKGDEWDELYVRRRVGSAGDSGVWAGARLIASDVHWSSETGPQIAGIGSDVDVVYVNRLRRLIYLRSEDTGYTFPHRTAFGPKGGCVADPKVARYGDLVVIAWDTWCAPFGTRVKVSVDGGETFGPTDVFDFGIHGVAITKGAVYVTGYVGGGSLVLRRSLDWGVTWTRPRLLTVNAHPYHSSHGGGNIVAEAGDVYVSWVALTDPEEGEIPWVRFIRSPDGGVSWGPPRDLDAASIKTGGSYFPILNINDGVVRAVWARCDDGECFGNDSLRYSRKTKTGWTPIETFAGCCVPAGVGMVERIIVAYSGSCSGGGACARTAGP